MYGVAVGILHEEAWERHRMCWSTNAVAGSPNSRIESLRTEHWSFAREKPLLMEAAPWLVLPNGRTACPIKEKGHAIN
jgi:hypothetical protein